MDSGLVKSCAAMFGHSAGSIGVQYRRVRRALVQTVADVHVPWDDIPESTLLRFRRALREYHVVCSTNYDLLIYWAIMARQGAGFVDYFWGSDNRFDLADVSTSFAKTRVLYLHGGLHLVRDADGSARKRVVAGPSNLIDSFRQADDVPLFVSEGTARDKLRAIRRSDYLSFAYETLVAEADSLVVFGHRLGEQDSHIRNALRRAPRLAISIRPGAPSRVISDKAWYIRQLPKPRIEFFDSTTHPLGDPSLTVEY